jgi:putative tricarboxylic transport membrane protein
MTSESISSAPPPKPRWLQILRRPDTMAGLMFIAVGVAGLVLSWDYPIGTGVRMGTGYVPRLMLWILLGLGVVILAIGILERDPDIHDPPIRWRPLVLVPAALTVFALTIESLGFLIAGTLMVLIGGLASSQSRVVEVVISAAVLVLSVWAIFIVGLGLTFPVWPGG